MSCEWTVRVSGYLDDELDCAERSAFESHLAGCAACRRELESMRAMKEVTGSMKLKEFPDQAWERYWEGTYNRLERKVGWIALSVGAIILLGTALYELAVALVTDNTEPPWTRLAVGLACAGIAILFVSVVRERLFMRGRDPYREVRR